MNNQERDQLNQFLKQLGEVRLTAKDPEAETMIREASSKQPDAVYLLVQRAMLLDQALNAAKAQIADLQNQVQNSQASNRGGFLNNDPWAQPTANPGPVPGAGNYQTPRYAQPMPAQASAFGGAPSFLGNVATTAAGVVAGSFLFQGIENLLGHHASSPWSQAHADSGEHGSEHTTINNYYGDEATESALREANYDTYAEDSGADFQDDSDSDSEWI